MMGTEAVRKMFVPVWPCSWVIFPQPAMYPDFPTISMGTVGRQIGRMWVLKINDLGLMKFHWNSFNHLLVSRRLSQLQRRNIKTVGLCQSESETRVDEFLNNWMLLRWQRFINQSRILSVQFTEINDNFT